MVSEEKRCGQPLQKCVANIRVGLDALPRKLQCNIKGSNLLDLAVSPELLSDYSFSSRRVTASAIGFKYVSCGI